MAGSQAAAISARLDRLPASRHVWGLVVLLSLGGCFEMYDLFLSAYISPGLKDAGIFKDNEQGLFGQSDQATFLAATFAGLFVATLLFASVADRFGRRVIFTGSLLWYTVATVLMALQSSRVGIDLWRFVAGVGIGIELVTIDTYLTELVPKSLRGRVFAVSQAIQFLAIPLVALLSWQLIPREPLGIAGWRWVVLVPAVGAVVVWWIRRAVPESPRWLAQHGRLEEAEQVTAALEARVAAELGHPLPPPETAVAETGSARFAEIWRPPYRRRTIMLAVFNFFQTIGFYGFGNWVPSLLEAQGTGFRKSMAYSFAIAVAYPVGPLLCSLIADRFERKWQIVAAAVGTALFGLLFAQQSSHVWLIVFGVLITMSNNLLSYAYHAYQAELFPTRIRARAVGFVYSFSRLSTIFTSFLIAFFLQRWGSNGVFGFIAFSMAVVVISIGVFGPRTKGLALEEIAGSAPPHSPRPS